MTTPARFVALLLLFSISLYGADRKIIHYEISYLRIPLLDMTLTWIEDDSTVRVTYDNQLKPFIAFIHPTHNIYRVHFRKRDFAPLEWSKSISEGDFKFQLHARRTETGKRVRYLEGQEYDFPDGGFTVFSATHFLASKADEPGFFPAKIPVFVDGEVWQARVTRYDAVHPHRDHQLEGDQVLIQTELSKVGGSPVLEKNDVLTSEIATEGTQFLLWVSPDGTYSKAQFGKFPRAVVLRRVKN